MINSEPSRFLQEIDPQYFNIEGMIQKQSQPQIQRSSYGSKPQYATAKRAPETAFPPATIPKGFKPINKAVPAPASIDPNFVGDDTSNLQVGQQVEHARFGNGMVTSVEGSGEAKKANIEFENGHGKKTIVLKFAKLKIK
jgi:DNA helicase-2/ATP-dependent DNA helicase PcrA